MGLCTLVAIAMVHSDNRLASAIALSLFATGIALSLLLIAAYSRPFTGEISVRPDLPKAGHHKRDHSHATVDRFNPIPRFVVYDLGPPSRGGSPPRTENRFSCGTTYFFTSS